VGDLVYLDASNEPAYGGPVNPAVASAIHGARHNGAGRVCAEGDAAHNSIRETNDWNGGVAVRFCSVAQLTRAIDACAPEVAGNDRAVIGIANPYVGD
jgi:hypothetical protein